MTTIQWIEEGMIIEIKHIPIRNPKIQIYHSVNTNWIHKYFKKKDNTPTPNMNPYKFKL